MIRRIAGWCLLALIPITFVTLAALAGQLVELALATVFSAFLALVTFTGIHLLTGDEQRRN